MDNSWRSNLSHDSRDKFVNRINAIILSDSEAHISIYAEHIVCPQGCSNSNGIADDVVARLSAPYSWVRHLAVQVKLGNLQRHMPPPPGQDGVDELLGIARRFEEKIFQAANDQNDYLRKISLKLMSLETVSKGRNFLVTGGVTGATSTNLGEIEVENVFNIDVSAAPPETTIPFVEVLGPDGKKKRFAEGTRSGFVVQRFNLLNPNNTKPVVCIQAHKEGEEPIEYGPEVELQILHDKSWVLQSVSEYAFPIPDSNESRQSKKVCLRHQKSEGEVV